MIGLKVKGWNDITISQYKAIVKIVEDEYYSPVEKDAMVLALLCGVDEKQIWNLDVNEFNSLRGKMGFLSNFEFDKRWHLKRIKIDGEEYDVQADINKFSVAQYMDYQSLWKNKDSHMGSMLTVFLVPRGKKYNDGYDIQHLAEVFEENVSIVTYNCICFFFLRNLVTSTSASQLYSTYLMRKMMKTASPVEKEKMKKNLEEMEQKPVLICYV